MANYVLVARSRKDNSYKIIGIKECWYRKDGDDQYFSYKNPLEVIDLVTSRFPSSEAMAARLCSNGYIPDTDYDFFIAANNRNNSLVKFHEVIYRPEESIERVDELRKVAKSSIVDDMKSANVEVLRIFNKLISKVFYRDEYYQMLMDGYTGLPRKLTSTVPDIRKGSSPQYRYKYDQGWALQSYAILRSIVESLNRYDYLATKGRGRDISEANVYFFSENIRRRKELAPQLGRILDKDFSVGQTSLFDEGIADVFAVPKEKVVEEPVADTTMVESPVEGVTVEESKPIIKFPVMGAVTEEDKLRKVISFLCSLPYGTFKYVNNQLTFNFNIFDYELDDEVKKKLNSLLTGHLRGNVHAYCFHKSKRDEINGRCYGHDVFILEEDMDAERKSISKALQKSNARLNRVYEWCRICSNCGLMNKEMLLRGEQEKQDEKTHK